jgi:uncharacterized protein
MTGPTVHERIRSLDFLRGAAVLGILWANVALFTSPFLAMAQPAATNGPELWGEWGSAIHSCLVAGKFRAVLATLFGVGLWLQYLKRRSVGEAWPASYLWRMFWLGVLGVSHMLFLWLGDVLAAYAVTAMVASLFVTFSDRFLIATSAALILANLGIAGLAVSASLLWAESGSVDDPFLWLFTTVLPAAETAIFRSGAWHDQLGFRALATPIVAFGSVVAPLTLLHHLLIGIVLARSGVLARPSGSPRIRDWCLAVGFGVGIPMNALPFLNPWLGWDVPFELVNELGGNAVLALGYLVAGAVWVENGALRRMVDLVGTVGRYALSCYLLQSAVCSALFYSWGLRLYGQVAGWWLAGCVLAVWAVVAVFALLLSRTTETGPAEWAWRSLSERRLLPFRRIRSRSTDASEA